MSLNIKEIEAILPHRYPFLMIDRIDELEPLKRARGYKNVTYNEPFFQGHFPDEPVMPGVLIIEALAQTGACAALCADEYKGKTAYFLGLDKVRFKNKVVPGDKLELECIIEHFKNGKGKGIGIAYVDGKVVCEAEILFIVR
ncbi:MAG: 3-hydroxyacyl-ACP dehydratase FabZ [Spirochaetes bacterium]|nr:3-hydroxyacyl-ACP dehydratase FabZ [Spirochaetota bacterium]